MRSVCRTDKRGKPAQSARSRLEPCEFRCTYAGKQLQMQIFRERTGQNMPWNDNNGGSGGGKGPWGAGGSGGSSGGGGGGKDPSPWNRPGGSGGGKRGDFEDQMRRMQERFKLRGSGNGRGGRGVGGGGIGPFGFLIVGLVALMAWFSTGIVVVDAGQQASIFRFGKFVTNYSPGLHLHWPAPIETHVIQSVERQQEMRIGADVSESLMLTGDENIVNIRFNVFWKINSTNPEHFILNVEDPEGTVKGVAESVMREIIGKRDLQPIITTARGEIQTAVREQTQTLLDQYRAGVDILDVQILESDAPPPVVDAFRDVVNAAAEAATNINGAQRFANQAVPEARGEAARIVNQAVAYRDSEIARARGEASRFTQLLAEYRKAPRVTRERMFLETMETVLGRSEKIILDNEAGTVPFLPLDRLGNRNNQER